MKMKFLTCLLFIMCFQSLSTSAHNMITTKRGGYELSKHLLEGKQLQGESRVTGLNGESKGRRCDRADELVHVSKAQKGKGSYGGANMVRRPPKHKSGASTLLQARPSASLISTSLLHVSFGSILVIILFFI